MVDETIDFDCLVLSGGPDSVARHVTENLLFYHALKLNKPIVGVCHGSFAVNDLTGGVNGTVPGHENSEHDIIMDGETIFIPLLKKVINLKNSLDIKVNVMLRYYVNPQSFKWKDKIIFEIL